MMTWEGNFNQPKDTMRILLALLLVLLLISLVRSQEGGVETETAASDAVEGGEATSGETDEVGSDGGSSEPAEIVGETVAEVSGEKAEVEVSGEKASKEEMESVKAAQAKRSADKEAARLARKKRELEEIETLMAKKEGTKATQVEEKPKTETKKAKDEVAKPSSSGPLGSLLAVFKKILSLLMFWKK